MLFFELKIHLTLSLKLIWHWAKNSHDFELKTPLTLRSKITWILTQFKLKFHKFLRVFTLKFKIFQALISLCFQFESSLITFPTLTQILLDLQINIYANVSKMCANLSSKFTRSSTQQISRLSKLLTVHFLIWFICM